MKVILNSDDGLTAFSTSVFWDNAGTSAVSGTAEWVGIAVFFNMMTGLPTHFINPTAAPFPGLINNDPFFLVVNGFDGLLTPLPNDPPNLPAGSYQIGTIVWHFGGQGTTNINAGMTAFDDFGVGGTFIASSVSFGGATLNVVPEPATASLLGLGLIGLIMAGRRKRA